jgi:signal transduction histidine kinase
LVAPIVADLQSHKPLDVSVRIGELPQTQGDVSLITQLYVNLLSNAFKFTGQRQDASIEISSIRRANEVVYYVRDNGIGFDASKADRLFDAFQRLHSSEQYEGSGVGLSIVHRIVQRHGGRIWAEAALGQGATFYFTLDDESRADPGPDSK